MKLHTGSRKFTLGSATIIGIDMAQHRHLFVMDSVENLNLKLDSSLRMAQALLQLGHECYMATMEELSWHMVNGREEVQARATTLTKSQEQTPEIGDKRTLTGEDISAVYMRKDPPFNNDYLSCTWILSALEKTSKVYNGSQVLRDKNEKLIILDYPEYIQNALVSSDPEEITTFIKEHCRGDGIIKPLDLYGGRGVARISLDDPECKDKLIENLGDSNKRRIVQPFDKKIHEGEVRVFTAGGEIVSWCLKVPEKGNYLANTRAGAEVLPYEPSADEIKMVETVSGDLMTKEVFLVGYDLIGGKISEINITSPRLLLPPEDDPSPYYKRLADLIETDLKN